MDHETIDRLQSLYFKAKLATVDAAKLEEAMKRIARNNAFTRQTPEPGHSMHNPERMPISWRWQEILQDWRHPW